MRFDPGVRPHTGIIGTDMYPLTICSHDRLIIAPDGWFSRIGNIDFHARTLRINVGRHGQAGFRWLIDADGSFRSLGWAGLEPATLLQTLRIARRVERYSLSEPRRITVGELGALVADLAEAFEEAPNSADLRALLADRPQDETVSRELMQSYLGA